MILRQTNAGQSKVGLAEHGKVIGNLSCREKHTAMIQVGDVVEMEMKTGAGGWMTNKTFTCEMVIDKVRSTRERLTHDSKLLLHYFPHFSSAQYPTEVLSVIVHGRSTSPCSPTLRRINCGVKVFPIKWQSNHNPSFFLTFIIKGSIWIGRQLL